MAKKIKTNALRMLDKAKIAYEVKEYQYDEEHLSGEHIIDQVDLAAKDIFKTLVLKGNNGYLVCCIPVLEQIDLKKLAKLSNNKSVEMIHMKDLLGVTGYIRGGCSPVGMKKQFPTYFDRSIEECTQVAFSAGKRGYQMVVDPHDIINYLNGIVGDVIRS
ncbi:Cys-tRNA(Pro) deacylase [uncultured Thomasclavelia sp.]|uniref:Cys-tRNA(Pro) deacylase n=1 Tax=uncultured Thomasclavelia sp. TaxID=3025759 RepID=UPI0025FF50AC|nr:Cys-tRNA(Pro) deacylase [uncultured Thomasclavelia sp.]